MPVYTYRREDGTTFEHRQKFLDEPLQLCPTTGQRVVRIVQNPGVIFKGSGFYVNDSKDASKRNLSSSSNGKKDGDGANGSTAKPEATSAKASEAAASTAAD